MSRHPLSQPLARCRAAAALVTALAGTVLAVAAWLGAPPAAAGHPAVHRTIRLVRSHPATVHGTGFAPHSRVRLVLTARHSSVAVVRASGLGTFTATFPTVVDRCTGWTVTATQAGAPRLVVHGPRPECAPA